MRVTLHRGITRDELLDLRARLMDVLHHNNERVKTIVEQGGSQDALELWEGSYQEHLNDLGRVNKALQKLELAQ